MPTNDHDLDTDAWAAYWKKKPPETSANSQTQKDENNLWLYFQ